MHRTRLLLAAAAIVMLGLFGFARPSLAEGEEDGHGDATEALHTVEEEAIANGGTEFDAHCIELLAEGKSVDDCQAAPNPLLPETNEIIWGAVGFLVVFGFVFWKGYPSMKKAMNARTERIQGDLDAAEAQRSESNEILAQYQAQLAEARTESARIIEEARQAADEVKANLQAKAEADIADLRTRATADIESAKAQAVADLRGEVAALAIGAAEQVVERSLDQDTNVALVEAYINQVGAELMTDDRTTAYAEALLAVARAEGPLAEVEDELFRVAQVVKGNDELRDKLADPHIPAATRQQIVVDLLDGKAQPATVSLVSLVVANGRVRELPAIVDEYVAMSAREANKEVAEVRSAIALTDDQKSRLADALGQATGKQVEIKVIIDPSIKGGVVAQVGDTVIDGSVRRRLDQLKNAL